MHDRAPAPFLKWVGGKRQLLPFITRRVPFEIQTYYEPFLGGAAVFFALAARGGFRRAVLADANPELVACYSAVRDDVAGVIAALRSARYRNDSVHYYDVRGTDPAKLTAAHRAARVIYLNRCGFNGLYRVNSRGKFNVPFGRYERPNICDAVRLMAASRALQDVEIRHADFGALLPEAGKRDFVYLDPPYVPISKTASFTGYAAGDFDSDQQQRLADGLRDLSRREVPALLSNSDCASTRRLYQGLAHDKVRARRAVNSDGRGRGAVGELLVRSFDYPCEAHPVARASQRGTVRVARAR